MTKLYGRADPQRLEQAAARDSGAVAKQMAKDKKA